MKLVNSEVDNKKVILRLDLNVTIKDGEIIDDTKIKKSLPTIKYLMAHNNRILIMSHLGKVKIEEDKIKNDLRIVANRLSDLLNENVFFVNDTRGNELENALNDNNVVLMQNTRYEDIDGKKESTCDLELAKYWSSLADVFVIDAFGTTHRQHASTYGIAKFIPAYYGFLIDEELRGLKPIISEVNKPFTVIMGGAKVDDKIKLIESMLDRCDYLLVGGGIANTFLKATDVNIGSSLYSADYVEQISALYNKYKDKIKLPIDVIVNRNDEAVTSLLTDLSDNDSIYDIGPDTINEYMNIINSSNTIFVNGTMGMYEDEKYKNGTVGLYEVLKNSNAVKIAGGGDALASINNLGYADTFNFMSTGGGATLEYIASGEIAVFKDL